MSYGPEDAARDEAIESLSRELYPEHREQAISEFTADRLRSYYALHPDVAAPGVRAYKEAKVLLGAGHFSAALVFAASATEIFLKTALLRPIVYGLVHSEALAQAVVDSALSQTGFSRYDKLLSRLFSELVGGDLKAFVRTEGSKPLLLEATEMRDLRNGVVHRGDATTKEQADLAVQVAAHVFIRVLGATLEAIGLCIGEGGQIAPLPEV